MTANDLFKSCVLKMYGETCLLCEAVRQARPLKATTIHHVTMKGMGGCSLNVRYNPLNGVPVCDECHRHIHDVIGERKGREIIISLVPLLSNGLTKYPLRGSTKGEVASELRELLSNL